MLYPPKQLPICFYGTGGSPFVPMKPPASTPAPALPITIRRDYAEDRLALARLAALDSTEKVPSAPLLLAEIDGELRVALSLRDGSSIADPFVPTAEVLGLLRVHAASAT